MIFISIFIRSRRLLLIASPNPDPSLLLASSALVNLWVMSSLEKFIL